MLAQIKLAQKSIPQLKEKLKFLERREKEISQIRQWWNDNIKQLVVIFKAFETILLLSQEGVVLSSFCKQIKKKGEVQKFSLLPKIQLACSLSASIPRTLRRIFFFNHQFRSYMKNPSYCEKTWQEIEKEKQQNQTTQIFLPDDIWILWNEKQRLSWFENWILFEKIQLAKIKEQKQLLEEISLQNSQNNQQKKNKKEDGTFKQTKSIATDTTSIEAAHVLGNYTNAEHLSTKLWIEWGCQNVSNLEIIDAAYQADRPRKKFEQAEQHARWWWQLYHYYSTVWDILWKNPLTLQSTSTFFKQFMKEKTKHAQTQQQSNQAKSFAAQQDKNKKSTGFQPLFSSSSSPSFPSSSFSNRVERGEKESKKIFMDSNMSSPAPFESIPSDLRAALLFAKLQGSLCNHLFPQSGLYLAPWGLLFDQNQDRVDDDEKQALQFKSKSKLKPKSKSKSREDSSFLFTSKEEVLSFLNHLVCSNLGIFTFIPRFCDELIVQWVGKVDLTSQIDKKLFFDTSKNKNDFLWYRKQEYLQSFQIHNKQYSIDVVDEKGEFLVASDSKNSTKRIEAIAHFANEPPPGKQDNVLAVQLILSPLMTKNSPNNTNLMGQSQIWLKSIKETCANEELFLFYHTLETSTQEEVKMHYEKGEHTPQTKRTLRFPIQSHVLRTALQINPLLQKKVASWFRSRMDKHSLDDFCWRKLHSPSRHSHLVRQ